MAQSNNFYRENDSDRVWWTHDPDRIGEFLFSFDKKKIYNLFRDYPTKLNKEEKEIFDSENPEWAEFFSDRN